jgi:hypothetical protein
MCEHSFSSAFKPYNQIMTLNLLIPHSWLLLIYKALLFAARQEHANGIFEGTIDNVVCNFTLSTMLECYGCLGYPNLHIVHNHI